MANCLVVYAKHQRSNQLIFNERKRGRKFKFISASASAAQLPGEEQAAFPLKAKGKNESGQS